MMIKHAFFGHCVSLGDALVMNAIVHHVSRNCEHVYYPAKPSTVATLACLYQDHNNITVKAFDTLAQQREFIQEHQLVHLLETSPLETHLIHRVNCEPEYVHALWQHQIYDNYDLAYSTRYRDFHMPTTIAGEDELYQQLNPNNEEYVLVHRYTGTHPQGIPIYIDTNLKCIEVSEGVSENLLAYRKLIRCASEIHCVSSSFFTLVDSMTQDTAAKLFFHDIRKNSLMRINSRWNNWRWEIIHYNIRV